ncbi:MAG TPA: DUF72 domain-containing protein [Gemmatimonadales bacterium]|nr:DUF72 domain-containing protein [Gemmatimonadales bacterium]
MSDDAQGFDNAPPPPGSGDLARLGAAVPPLIHFGTSSWTYPGWRGLVYHRDYAGKGMAAAMLDEYAKFPLFRTVGIDSTFYAPPTEAMLRSYAERLPPGFPCVSKVWHQLTAFSWTKAQSKTKAGQKNPDFLNPEVFLEAVYEPTCTYFADHVGAFVFEFQQIFRSSGITPQRFADLLDAFFSELPREGRYAVEIRNEDFLTPAYFAVLREHGVAHVLNSWTRMPSIGTQLDLPGVLTGSFIVARALLRPGRTYDEAVDAFAPYDRIREPDPEVRTDLLGVITAALRTRIPAYVLVNNRLEGSAPRTIIELALETVAEAGSGS